MHEAGLLKIYKIILHITLSKEQVFENNALRIFGCKDEVSENLGDIVAITCT